MEPKEAPAEASVPNLKGIWLSVSTQGRSGWFRKFFAWKEKNLPLCSQKMLPVPLSRAKGGLTWTHLEQSACGETGPLGDSRNAGASVLGSTGTCLSKSICTLCRHGVLLFCFPWEWIHVNKPEATPSARGKSFLSCSYIISLIPT